MLYHCPHCDGKVNDDIDNCPHCGEYMEEVVEYEYKANPLDDIQKRMNSKQGTTTWDGLSSTTAKQESFSIKAGAPCIYCGKSTPNSTASIGLKYSQGQAIQSIGPFPACSSCHSSAEVKDSRSLLQGFWHFYLFGFVFIGVFAFIHFKGNNDTIQETLILAGVIALVTSIAPGAFGFMLSRSSNIDKKKND